MCGEISSFPFMLVLLERDGEAGCSQADHGGSFEELCSLLKWSFLHAVKVSDGAERTEVPPLGVKCACKKKEKKTSFPRGHIIHWSFPEGPEKTLHAAKVQKGSVYYFLLV